MLIGLVIQLPRNLPHVIVYFLVIPLFPDRVRNKMLLLFLEPRQSIVQCPQQLKRLFIFVAFLVISIFLIRLLHFSTVIISVSSRLLIIQYFMRGPNILRLTLILSVNKLSRTRQFYFFMSHPLKACRFLHKDLTRSSILVSCTQTHFV